MSERMAQNIEQGYSPETPHGDFLESLDITHEMERVVSIIIESGPELEPDHLSSLRNYLYDLMARLNIPLDEPDILQHLIVIKENVGVSNDVVTLTLLRHSLPEELRQVIEKIIAGRHEGLSDRAIYRRLARVYHPDQTPLDPQVSENVFKLIGKHLYNEHDGFTKVLGSNDQEL